MWPVASSRPINYGHVAQDMVGLRDVFLVAPASSFHHHHHHNHNETLITESHSLNGSNPATALGVGVIPLLGGGIQLWQEQQHQQNQQQTHYLKKHALVEHNDSGGGGGITALVTNSGGGGTTTCQDCGNQAKKDCSHRRCRTCCKSRGFDCATHVKSTWVPAARRRERQLMTETAAVAGGSTGSTGHAKKPRLVASQTTTTSHTSTSNTTPPRSFDTSSSHQDASFKETMPCQVRAPAVFKCVRVTAMEDGEDEFAYQATVKIGGHVFKGLLYDKGVEDKDGYPNLSELHLGGGGTGNVGSVSGAGRNGVSSSSPLMDPSDVYAASGSGGFLGGSSTYGNPIN